MLAGQNYHAIVARERTHPTPARPFLPGKPAEHCRPPDAETILPGQGGRHDFPADQSRTDEILGDASLVEQPFGCGRFVFRPRPVVVKQPGGIPCVPARPIHPADEYIHVFRIAVEVVESLVTPQQHQIEPWQITVRGRAVLRLRQIEFPGSFGQPAGIVQINPIAGISITTRRHPATATPYYRNRPPCPDALRAA